MKVFGFHFAGGNKYSYQPLREKLESHFDFKVVELPGRGARTGQPFIRNCDEAVDDLYEQIKNEISEEYVFFGHSMGGFLAYLLSHKIFLQGGALPNHVFISSCPAPNHVKAFSHRHLLQKDELKEELRIMGGVPNEILEDDMAFSFFEKIIRSDFEVIDTYQGKRCLNTLHVPLTLLKGNDERITKKQMLDWQIETSSNITYQEFVGGHFYLFNHIEALAKIITRRNHE